MKPNLSAVFRDDQNVSLHTPQVTWSILREGSQMLDAISEREPIMRSICERLEQKLPCQRLWGFGETGAYIRPDRHARAFYLRLAEIEGARSNGGCIAIKGGEAVCENFDAMVLRLKRMWNIVGTTFGDTSRAWYDDWGMMSSLDRYPVCEGKPPGVLSLVDVTEEATAAFQIQKAYWERYGELAHLPVPLFGYAWSDAECDQIWHHLKPHLSPAAQPLVEAQLQGGIGAYVYYYPSLPLRVEHIQIEDIGSSISYAERFFQLNKLTNPQDAISSWLQQTARLLCLGYVPTPATSMGRGYCVQAQNAVLDGGFVDLGGLQSVDLFQNESDLAFALSRTMQILGKTIGRFLIGTFADSDVFISRVPGVFALVWDGIRHHVAQEIAMGHPVPEAVQKFMVKETPTNDLLYLFSQLFSVDTYKTEDGETSDVRLVA